MDQWTASSQLFFRLLLHISTAQMLEIFAWQNLHWTALELSTVPISNALPNFLLGKNLVEAGGIEPPSEGLRSNMTTCLADVLISLIEPPTAGSL
jgi:hypothetical protein